MSVNEQTCGVARPTCSRCNAELLFSARARGDGMCGPCSRSQYNAEQRPLRTASVGLVERAPNPECKVRMPATAPTPASPLYALWIPNDGRPATFTPVGLDANDAAVITLDDQIDDVTLRDLLFYDEQRRAESPSNCKPHTFTAAQRATVSAYHSAQLRAKVAATRAAEAERKLTVMVDRDLDEVE